MSVCAMCKNAVEVEKFFTRKSTCPSCGEDLHTCLNCGLYSESKHNKCLEPKAEFQRVRDKANFCDFFSFSGGQGRLGRDKQSPSGSEDKQDAREKLKEIFGK